MPGPHYALLELHVRAPPPRLFSCSKLGGTLFLSAGSDFWAPRAPFLHFAALFRSAGVAFSVFLSVTRRHDSLCLRRVGLRYVRPAKHQATPSPDCLPGRPRHQLYNLTILEHKCRRPALLILSSCHASRLINATKIFYKLRTDWMITNVKHFLAGHATTSRSKIHL